MPDLSPLRSDEHYHDIPERHKFGYAFLLPDTTTSVTPLVTQATNVGVAEAPARADHTHGITAVVIPAIATAVPTTITPLVTQTAAIGAGPKYAASDHTHGITAVIPSDATSVTTSTSTAVAGSGSLVNGLASATTTLVNNSPVARLCRISAQCRVDILNNHATAVKAGYQYINFAFTTDGSAPTSYNQLGIEIGGGSALPAASAFYTNVTGETYVSVPAGATLSVIFRFSLYGVDGNISFAYQQHVGILFIV